jgi:hypothetical protein
MKLLRMPYWWAWRTLARVLPASWKRELPGWGYLELFTTTYASTPGPERGAYLTFAFADGQPYAYVLHRAGGIRPAFRLIFGKTVPEPVAELFADEPNLPVDKVRTDDVANNVVVSLNFIDGPRELRE